MAIFLVADQTHGMEWKKKRLKKKEDVYKLTTLLLRPIGKFLYSPHINFF